jgi:hypothetical protein
MLEGKQEKLGIFYEEDFDTAAQLVCKKVWVRVDAAVFKLIEKIYLK